MEIRIQRKGEKSQLTMAAMDLGQVAEVLEDKEGNPLRRVVQYIGTHDNRYIWIIVGKNDWYSSPVGESKPALPIRLLEPGDTLLFTKY